MRTVWAGTEVGEIEATASWFNRHVAKASCSMRACRAPDNGKPGTWRRCRDDGVKLDAVLSPEAPARGGQCCRVAGIVIGSARNRAASERGHGIGGTLRHPCRSNQCDAGPSLQLRDQSPGVHLSTAVRTFKGPVCNTVDALSAVPRRYCAGMQRLEEQVFGQRQWGSSSARAHAAWPSGGHVLHAMTISRTQGGKYEGAVYTSKGPLSRGPRANIDATSCRIKWIASQPWTNRSRRSVA